jgi:hypothetical protein
MSKLQFTKAFTQQEAIPEQAKKRVMELLDSGRLHRYNTVLLSVHFWGLWNPHCFAGYGFASW